MTTLQPFRQKLTVPRRLKPYLLTLYQAGLGMTARLRAMTMETRLPDFLIIGAQKCGTTYLYEKLVEHPQVLSALTKEVHFFDNAYHEGEAWYRGHFPGKGGDDITGEASPYYIVHPHAARRVRDTAPNAKLILLLRNPVNRAYSHYHHEARLGFEPLTFAEALAQEEKRLSGEVEKMLKDERYYSYAHQHYAYRLKGLYADQLKGWFNLFPQAQLLVLKSETFYQNTPAVMRQVTDFLGIPAWDGWQFSPPKSNGYAKIDPALRQTLAAYYAPHNQRLYELIGADFGWEK